jgi:hypothetical protein
MPDFAAPFCAGRRDVSPHHGAVEHLYEVCRLARFRKQLEERLEHTRAAQPPEPLPDAVPLTERSRQGSPRYAVNREIMQRLQELTVIVSNRGKSVGTA